MGMFNSIGKFTSKVMAKFKNTGYNKGEIPISVATNAFAKAKTVDNVTAKKGKSHKKQPNVYYNFFRKLFKKSDKEGLLRPIKHFGNFSVVGSFNYTRGARTERTVDRTTVHIHKRSGFTRGVVHTTNVKAI